DLDVDIVPGQRAEFRFEGDRPPAPSRRAIASLYRGDFYEASSLEEMRQRTIRVFRALSHIDPKVDVSVVRPSSAEEPRVVTVRVEAGPRVELEAPRFVGVTAAEAAFLASRFPGPVERAELVAESRSGPSNAERRL